MITITRFKQSICKVQLPFQFQVPRSVCNELCQPGSRKVSYPGKPFCCYDCISCMDGEYSNNTEETEQNNNSQKYKLLKNWVVLFISLGPQITLSLTWIFVGQTHVNLNTQVHPGIIIVECGGDSPAWAVCNITFLGVMAAICLGLASKAQKLPSAKNEAKFITFSMLTFLLVGLAFIPANSSTQGKFKIATEIFALIAIAYSLLGCIFITKCYSMLFKMK
uniref:G-protein coupled receptors family 3 profile domain-containing protein n=2 Tax=Eptatretus burgeri TaxID=7764 RepID=A0A8C4QXD4_EPTBU